MKAPRKARAYAYATHGEFIDALREVLGLAPLPCTTFTKREEFGDNVTTYAWPWKEHEDFSEADYFDPPRAK